MLYTGIPQIGHQPLRGFLQGAVDNFLSQSMWFN
jgi:hypothetical protein